MIIRRKKKGFTVTELVIAMTIMITVLGILWAMFSISNKTISDVTIKSDLQSEGQAIQEKLSNIMMQATVIKSIDGDSLTGEINSIKFESYGSDLNLEEFAIEKVESGDNYKDGGKNYKLSIRNNVNTNNLTISNNVKSIKISNPEVIQYSGEALRNVKTAEFYIILKKENGYSKNIEYPISIKARFRNNSKG
ncbi:type II secretion system GspH family protein [Clostridium sp. SHJSY1]|uniref:PilW family protein n=1 Tax=Clostridium sp. SHJSY1 TaxID=2942483 RepID=UPI00287490FE|nr:type II secretion system protein [Clostridium sp. SHJSY1]MDS0525684.1 type II secretion system GspH family protein [Clostridium sp. SHJSY1]